MEGVKRRIFYKMMSFLNMWNYSNTFPAARLCVQFINQDSMLEIYQVR
jgi:hypothetical protein